MIQQALLGAAAGTGFTSPDDHDRRRHGILYENGSPVQLMQQIFLGFASGVMIAASI